MAGTCTGPGPCDTKPFGTGDNWVNRAGGLPDYIRAVAHAFRRKGLSESAAIERAVGVIRNWAEGKGGVTPQTRARAAKALAEWEALKVKAHALATAAGVGVVDLAEATHVYHWRHGWVPITPHAALQKAHGSHAGAAKLLHANGQHEDAHAMLRVGLAHHEAAGHTKTAARYRQALATRVEQPARLQVRPGVYQGESGHHIVGSDARGRRVGVFVAGDRAAADRAAENIRAGRSAFSAPPAAPVHSGIHIEHTGDGTLVHGTSRGDGSGEVLKRHGFRWSSNLGAWYLPRGQHESTRRMKADAAHADLVNAGHSVRLTKEAAGMTTAAEREAQQRERSATRAERLGSKAERLHHEADVRHDAARQIMDRIPMGQPILIGHHSERGHRADMNRIDRHITKSLETRADANAAERAAEAARRNAERSDSPLMRQRRIDRNEADLRKIDRALQRHDIAVAKPEAAARLGVHPSSDTHLEQLRAERARLADQIAHDKAQIAAAGHVGVQREAIKPGDVIRYRGRVHVVKKVNKTTVSVPTGYSWDDKVPINQIQAHTPHANLTPEMQAQARKVASLSTPVAVDTVDLAGAWDEAKHPRVGGKFAPKGTTSSSAGPAARNGGAMPPGMRAQVLDFQRRTGLPQTGTLDAATRAKINGLTTPKAGGGKGGKAAKHAAALKRKAARAKVAAAHKALAAKRKAARKTAAAARHRNVTVRQATGRTVAAVNGLTTGQRAAYRKQRPNAPAGFYWTAANRLRPIPNAQAQQVAAVLTH